MARKIEKGDRVLVEAKVSRVWGDGKVSMYLPGCDTPVTIHQDDVHEVIKAPKEPFRRPRKFYDNPDRE